MGFQLLLFFVIYRTRVILRVIRLKLLEVKFVVLLYMITREENLYLRQLPAVSEREILYLAIPMLNLKLVSSLNGIILYVMYFPTEYKKYIFFYFVCFFCVCVVCITVHNISLIYIL